MDLCKEGGGWILKRTASEETRLDLRGERAQDAFSLFCLSWLDVGREIVFASADTMLRTADDVTATTCSSRRLRGGRRRRYRETVEVDSDAG